MSKKFYGGIDIQTQSKLKLFNSADSHAVSLKAPTLSADLDLILPSADTASGALVSDGSGNLSLSLLADANISSSAAIAYSKLSLTGSIVNADISSSAAIAYSKLNLSASIVNADISATAAIAYSKLNLTGNIVNADINASAAIARSKLAALTANRAVVTDGSGFDTVSLTTDTEIGYVSGVTSSIQTQLDGKQPLASELTAIAALATTGLIVRTGSGTAATRSIVAGTGISVSNGDGVSGNITISSSSSLASFKTDWANADGTSKTVTHNLGSTDVIVQLFDTSTAATIEVDSVVRTDSNTVTLTASAAPSVSWRVLILAV